MAAEINAPARSRKKPAAAKAVPAAPEQDAAPVGLLLFEKDGRTWETSADRSFGSALAYLRSIKKKKGTIYAEMELLERLVGSEETDAILAAVASRAEWREIVSRAVNYHLGDPEPDEPEGN